MRSYRDQFEPEVADRIDCLIRRIKNLEYPTGPTRYYGLDLAACLQVGALSGSLVVAASLMELYIRGLVVRYSEDAQRGWSRPVETERELDNMKDKGFRHLVGKLVESGLFDSEAAARAKELYKTVRIPVHHGLPSRFFSGPAPSLMIGIFGTVEKAGPVSMKQFEDFIEEDALPTIEAIVGILESNQYGTFT